MLEDVLDQLGQAGVPLEDAKVTVPSVPGLYAFHGSANTWSQLGLGEPPDTRPLYVGRSLSSLLGRDVFTHFSTGKTGSSTLRRSVAALLKAPLQLRAQPRNSGNPERFANFGLDFDSDVRVTMWMTEHLRLAVWPCPNLDLVKESETAALKVLLPPLNLAGIDTPWRSRVSAARAQMARDAAEWRAP